MKTKAEIERFCKYCEHAEELRDGNTMLCKTRGVVSSGACCHRFRYDPLKRTPIMPGAERNVALLSLDFVDI